MLNRAVIDALDELNDREKAVVRLRFGLDDGQARTLEEVGKEFGVTRERIRQIESKTLAKLRHPHRSEEHTSELQSLMRSSYAVFCLKKKKKTEDKHEQKDKHTEKTEKK